MKMRDRESVFICHTHNGFLEESFWNTYVSYMHVHVYTPTIR